MEERIQISVLFDVYGMLLTNKQKNIMDLYYNYDLSLGEIAEHTDTTRQAVYDIIKRCHKLLSQYEEKLNLVTRKMKLQESKKILLDMLDLLESSKDEKFIGKIRNYIIDNI